MTGHAFDRRAAQQTPPAAGPALPRVRVLGPSQGYRHFFGQPAPADCFGADMFGRDGTISADKRETLHKRMNQLAHRIRIGSDIPLDPKAIPSGYTYLLQFIAHDMVDTTMSVNVADDRLEFAFANARARPLCLDTLYGAGPDEAPHAYEAASPDGPRTRLRIARPEKDPAVNGRCLRRDIGRALETEAAWGTLKSGIALALPGGDDAHAPDQGAGRGRRTREGRVSEVAESAAGASGWNTQALLADPRNDAHALMSQTTLLFSALHNVIVDLLDAQSSRRDSLEWAYRRFLCARTAVTLIYREIIFKDLLRRVLYKPVYDHYVTNQMPPCDSGSGVPIEFSHGAFRFGHAMVRDAYSVNNLSDELPTRAAPFTEAMAQTSATKSVPEIVAREWHVDWDRFFFDGSATGTGRNFAMAICPHEGDALQFEFSAKTRGVDWWGLAERDLLSACYGRVWSVPKLMARLAPMARQRTGRARGPTLPPIEPGHFDFDRWQPRIKDWLEQHNEGERFDPGQWPKIAADPPLPFFVLFEAMETSQGTCLGPLGSIILAETFRAAIAQAPLGGSIKGSLASRLEQCAAALLPGATDRLREVAAASIDSMPQLLKFLASKDVFAANA